MLVRLCQSETVLGPFPTQHLSAKWCMLGNGVSDQPFGADALFQENKGGLVARPQGFHVGPSLSDCMWRPNTLMPFVDDKFVIL